METSAGNQISRWVGHVVTPLTPSVGSDDRPVETEEGSSNAPVTALRGAFQATPPLEA
jgi:hypothetical protein